VWDPDLRTWGEDRLWRAADRSGQRHVVEVDSSAPATITTYRPGELDIVVDSPAADPPLLAVQLDAAEDFAAGPHAPLRAVLRLYQNHVLASVHRAAVLRVLADTPGLRYRGEVAIGDRRGIAVTADSQRGAVRDVAVFDATSGALLHYEQVELGTAEVVRSIVFLAAYRTDR
jgi:hypothetical protein